ncbi:MAG: helix-turn-helix domain-containing protein [Bacteroidia bacterium]
MMEENRVRLNVMFSCIGQEKSDYDPFIPEHAVSFIINGTMEITEADKKLSFSEGNVVFISKNQIIKIKKVPNQKPFTALSVILPKEILYKYAKDYHIEPKGVYIGNANFTIPNNYFLEGYLSSMVPYFEDPDALTDNLAQYKVLELIEVLRSDTRMQNILFTFAVDFKLDLEAYMNQYFMHNLPLEKFATLTGRSLSSFKRDFQEIFQTTPNKWLIKKRLDLAYHLISNKGQKPSEAYVDAGFVNFSHFSKSFKEAFGVNPSEI